MSYSLRFLLILVLGISVLHESKIESKAEAKATTLPASNVAIGSVQFPQTVSSVPSVCLYWCGRRIPESFCVIDGPSKRLTFTVQKDKTQRSFYLLVTESIRFVGPSQNMSDQKTSNQSMSHAYRKSGNTVDHLEVPADKPYKLYKMALRETQAIQPESSDKLKLIGQVNKKNKNIDSQYQWAVIEELALNSDRLVPDETLIIRWNPAHVTGTGGGYENELPTLLLAENIVELFGSEKLLQQYAIELLLASLESSMFHATMSQEIKVAGNRVLSLPITT